MVKDNNPNLLNDNESLIDNRFIGERIKEQRLKKGLTQAELADYLHLSNRVYVAQYETGERTVKISKIIQLSKLFGCTSDYLLGLTNASSLDNDMRIACDYIGMSENVINSLADIEPEYHRENNKLVEIRKAIDVLISCDYASTFYEALTSYRDVIEDCKETEKALNEYSRDELIQLWDEKLYEGGLSIDDKLILYAYKLGNEFNALLEKAFDIEQAKNTLKTNRNLIYKKMAGGK